MMGGGGREGGREGVREGVREGGREKWMLRVNLKKFSSFVCYKISVGELLPP